MLKRKVIKYFMIVAGLLIIIPTYAVFMKNTTENLTNRYQQEEHFYQSAEKTPKQALPIANKVTQQPTMATINAQQSTQPKMSSAVYVLKRQANNTLGGSAYQATELKSYLGKGY